jgi:hypothetical protein
MKPFRRAQHLPAAFLDDHAAVHDTIRSAARTAASRWRSPRSCGFRTSFRARSGRAPRTFASSGDTASTRRRSGASRPYAARRRPVTVSIASGSRPSVQPYGPWGRGGSLGDGFAPAPSAVQPAGGDQPRSDRQQQRRDQCSRRRSDALDSGMKGGATRTRPPPARSAPGGIGAGVERA